MRMNSFMLNRSRSRLPSSVLDLRSRSVRPRKVWILTLVLNLARGGHAHADEQLHAQPLAQQAAVFGIGLEVEIGETEEGLGLDVGVEADVEAGLTRVAAAVAAGMDHQVGGAGGHAVRTRSEERRVGKEC